MNVKGERLETWELLKSNLNSKCVKLLRAVERERERER